MAEKLTIYKEQISTSHYTRENGKYDAHIGSLACTAPCAIAITSAIVRLHCLRHNRVLHTLLA